MSVPKQDPAAPSAAGLTKERSLGSILVRLRREMRERWEWYKQQQREDRVRHWWDVYNR